MPENICPNCLFLRELSAVSPGTRKALSDARTVKAFRKGQFIFSQGTIPDVVCCASEGGVDVIHIDNHGDEKFIVSHPAGDGPFPFLAAVTRGPLPIAFVANARTRVCQFPYKLFQERVYSDPTMLQHCLKVWAARMQGIFQRLLIVLGSSAEKKVASAILQLRANKQGSDCTGSRKRIAEWTNLAPETVNRVLKKLEKRKLLVKTKRGTYECDIPKLKEFVGD